MTTVGMHTSSCPLETLDETVAVWAKGGTAGFTKRQPCQQRWEHMIQLPDIDTTGRGYIMQSSLTMPATFSDVFSVLLNSTSRLFN